MISISFSLILKKENTRGAKTPTVPVYICLPLPFQNGFASAVPNEIAETAGELHIHSVHTPRYRNGALEYERLEKRCVGNEIVGEDREMGWNSSPPFLDV